MNSTTTLQESPIQFSPLACKEIQRLLQENSKKHLRIGAKGGGCSGLTYILEFDENKEQDDKEFEFEGIQYIVKLSHLLYLKGMVIEFDKGLNARGFTFSNPNASNTCGCGSSFAV